MVGGRTDGVDSLAVCGEGVMEDIVARAGDGEDVVVFVDAQLFDVDVWVFPGLRTVGMYGRLGLTHP